MTKCNVCKMNFPDHLISPLVRSESLGGTIPQCCPICSLGLMNSALGFPPDTPFRGEQAQWMYEEAKKFLKKKGTSPPKKKE